MKKLLGGIALIFIVGVAVKSIGVFPVIVAGIICAGIIWQIKTLRTRAEENKRLLAHAERALSVIRPTYESAGFTLQEITKENLPPICEDMVARFIRIDMCYTESKLRGASSLMELSPIFLAYKVHRLLNEFIKESSDYLALFGEIRGFSDKMEVLKKEINESLALIDTTIASMQNSMKLLSGQSQKEFAHAIKQFEKTKKLLAKNRQIDRAAAVARLKEISVMLKKAGNGTYTLPKKVGVVIPLTKKTS